MVCSIEGNVWEWVWSDEKADTNSSLFRITRGGSWDYDAWFVRPSYRRTEYAASANSNQGFRLVRNP